MELIINNQIWKIEECKNHRERYSIFIATKNIKNYDTKDLVHGDFVEDLNLSGYRMNGVYQVITVDDQNYLFELSDMPGDYGTVLPMFNGFNYNPDYFHDSYYETNTKCCSYWHNQFVPLKVRDFMNSVDKDKNENPIIYNRDDRYINHMYIRHDIFVGNKADSKESAITKFKTRPCPVQINNVKYLLTKDDKFLQVLPENIPAPTMKFSLHGKKYEFEVFYDVMEQWEFLRNYLNCYIYFNYEIPDVVDMSTVYCIVSNKGEGVTEPFKLAIIKKERVELNELRMPC